MNKTYHPYNPYWYHDHKEMLKNMKIQDLIEDAKHQPHKKSISHKNIAMDMGISACIQPDEQLTEYYNKKYNLTFYFLYEEFVCYGKQTSLETNEYFYWTSKQDYQNVFYYIRSLIVKNPAYKSIKFDTIIEQMNATCEIETKPTSVEYSDSIYDENNLNETLGKFETAIRYLKTTSNTCSIECFNILQRNPSKGILTIFIDFFKKNIDIPMQTIISYKINWSKKHEFQQQLFEDIVDKYFQE